MARSHRQTDRHHRTDTASSHSEGFLRNLHKKVPLENVTRVPCVKYLSPRMNRKKTADNHRHTTDRHTDGGDDNT